MNRIPGRPDTGKNENERNDAAHAGPTATLRSRSTATATVVAAADDLFQAFLNVGENLVEVRRLLPAALPGILAVSTAASGLVPGHLVLRSVFRAKSGSRTDARHLRMSIRAIIKNSF
jgi:hypothetical protein